jgi:hypothetical protein
MAEAEARRPRVLPKAQASLAAYSLSAQSFRAKAEELGVATPTQEPIDLKKPPLSPPARFTVIGVDGSQIQPDPHSIATYYLINVGSIILEEGSGQAPKTKSIPYLYYKAEDLYENGRLVQGGVLDCRRALAEVRGVSAIAAEACGEGPTIALVDGPLFPWPGEDGYLEEVRKIREAGVRLAGFISRPRYFDVVDLLRLMRFGEKVFSYPPHRRPWGRLTDAVLFSFLPLGWRSALFQKGHTYFFYLNVFGEISRVELPDPDSIDLVQAVILKQSEHTQGYPYVLIRAHELAVVTASERKALEEMIEREMFRRGLSPLLLP